MNAAAWRPTKHQIEEAQDKRIPDILAPQLRVLFVGINPSLYSAAVGHHFARPGNRFWPTLHGAGITPRVLSPFEDGGLVDWECGLTNFVSRATARADELSSAELQRGTRSLVRKIKRRSIRCIAFLGITAFRTGFARPTATVGRQDEQIGASNVWALPNPSGLNAHYQLPDLIELFRAMWQETCREAEET
jgi:TDG/mug DNA glycosylase family protein